jgi:adenosylhomocysteine nucleosidase
VKIAIIVPMEIEAQFYLQHFPVERTVKYGVAEYRVFKIGQNEIFLGLSGIGKVQAAMNLASLLACQPIDLILVTGSAGSLQTNVKLKDLLLVNAFAYYDVHCQEAGDYQLGQIPHEPAEFALTGSAFDEFASFLQTKHVDYKTGLVVTGDSFLANEDDKRAIKADFPAAMAVEMEGAAFAQVAYHFQTPLVVLRAISDNGDQDANFNFDQFVAEVGKKAASLVVEYLESKAE